MMELLQIHFLPETPFVAVVGAWCLIHKDSRKCSPWPSGLKRYNISLFWILVEQINAVNELMKSSV